MMNIIRTSSPIFMVFFVLLISFSGCKSKKKAREAQAAAERARMEQEAATRRQQEEAAKKEAEETARREAEAREREAAASTPKAKLNNYFSAISGASNISAANSTINEALSLFASPETPVLIVISEEGGQKDYDRPTTIRDYLNYLKDQKKNINKISNVEFDGSGKITTLELTKN